MENKILVQSYNWTLMRNNYNIYVQRLMVKVIEQMQNYIEGLHFRNREDIRQIEPKNIPTEFKVRLTDLTPEGTKNMKHVKEMVNSVLDVKAELKTDTKYIGMVVFTTIEIDLRDGVNEVKVEMNRNAVLNFLDFSRGFRRYELQSAMKCKSAYAIRLYQLMSGQITPLRYEVEYLKKWLGVADKYKLTKDFIRRVLDEAKKDLDEQGAWSFTYKPIYGTPDGEKKKGRPQITAIEFKPYSNYVDEQLEQNELKHATTWYNLDKNVIKFLTEKVGYTTKELQNNIETFEKGQKIMGTELIYWLMDRQAKILNAKNPKGYLVNALKGELDNILNERYGTNRTR